MGLPMFREPDETVAEDAAAKLDRAAASRRSAIRREPTLRPGRYNTSAAIDRFREGRRDTLIDRARTFLNDEEREANQQIAALEAELERLRTVRLRHRARLDRAISRSRRQTGDRPEGGLLQDAIDLLSQSRTTYRADDDENTGVDPLPASPARQTISRHLPRPPRESNLRFEFGATGLPRVAPPLSPPISSGRVSQDRNVPDGPLPLDQDRPAELTPDFAPARGRHINRLRPSSTEDPNDSGLRDEIAALETPPPETWEAAYPPLRRVGHISPRPVGAPRVDGLGDRRRSPSPISDTHEEDTWANLLTTMDDGVSSMTSSFDSMRSDPGHRFRRAWLDAATSTNTSTNASTNTSTSFGEIGAVDDSCDLDLPSGITEEDVRQIREQQRHLQRLRSAEEPMTGERGLREHRERRARRLDLGMFQNILERMQRREEVPDDLWAAAGLPPDMVGNP